MTYEEWITKKEHHTCSCGHVQWAHWDNGTCAHCNCNGYDGQPKPPIKEES